MSIKNTFREIAIEKSPKQPLMVDQVLEEAPILGTLPMEETSNGLQHNYEEVESVTGAGLTDMDEALPEVNANTNLEKLDLSILGGIMEVGEDKARQFGGPGAYFAKKQPLILKKTGQDAEKSVLYNNIRATAITSGGDHLIDSLGVGATNYSILAVKWAAGETTGLFDPNGFGAGVMMDMAPISGGATYKDANGRLVYGLRMKSYFGIMLANKKYVSSIVNIDLANDKLPTEAQMDSLVESVRGQQGGNTVLYMHPKILTALYKYKASSLQTVNSDNELNRVFNFWNGIPMMTSYNFLQGTEPNVTV